MRCPYCQSQFFESDIKVGKFGKYVTCSACGMNINSVRLKMISYVDNNIDLLKRLSK